MPTSSLEPARRWTADDFHAADRRLQAVTEVRSTLTQDLVGAFPGDVTGTTGWQQGMVWAGYPGGTVTNDSAMRISAVFACLRLLSEAIATLPLDTFERVGGTRRPYRPRPAYLSFDPPMMPRTEYLSALMLSLLTDGNAFVATPRDVLGSPVALVPLDPTAVTVVRERGEVYYEAAGHRYTGFDIMHIKGMAMPGCLRGISPIAAARDVVRWGASAQDYGLAMMDNRATPPAVIQMPPDPKNDSTAEAARATRIAQKWNETHGGTSNAGKVGVLMGGATLNTVAITPEDAQWLDSKKFGVSEIARFFGVPPHLIADASNSTSWGSGLAEQNLAFGQFSLRPWTERIEEAHGRLLTTDGLPQVFMRLNLDALLRSSLTDRYASYATGIGSRFLTINEARSLEDLPPVPWGDQPAATSTGGAP